MATNWYVKGLEDCFDGTIDLFNDTLKIMLLSNTTVYTPSKAHLVVDAEGANDPVDAELSCTGYVPGWGNSGRKTAEITKAPNFTLARIEVTIGDLTWISLQAGYTVVAAVLIKEGTADDTTSRLIGYIDGPDRVTNGSDFKLDFLDSANGGNFRIAC